MEHNNTNHVWCTLGYRFISVAVLAHICFCYVLGWKLVITPARHPLQSTTGLPAGMSAMILVSRLNCNILHCIQAYVGDRCQVCDECTGFFSFDGVGWSMCCLSCYQTLCESTFMFGSADIVGATSMRVRSDGSCPCSSISLSSCFELVCFGI